MDPYGAENISTALALALTLWLVVFRFRAAAESNWPLLYYLGIVFFSYMYPNALEPRWIYAGVVTALFQRFEFLGGWFAKVIRVFEFIILVYVIVALGYHVALP